ncbi:hypothetical protein K470DRAFT_292877 [Piedraia hortae CBS 480.64]|uniref:SWR1-complex protein 3 domain-containing protein n=1 Tax=Piedraia hortae CBS 480.64 TaxID=1314780 RepID=A0A6A7C7L7_9PEZI|nr:hypothetical protein K470DRAFT_292877 [Piedraia hortae CBS 480.64]
MAQTADYPSKKVRLSIDVPAASPGPTVPSKITENKPLPTSTVPQSLDLPNAYYMSVAASEVLSAAIQRSQAQWTVKGIFERYWTRPETGKNARPPPVNNADPRWMKSKGECRIRIEPHIFRCEMFVEERPPGPAYGQAYRPPPQPLPTQQAVKHTLPATAPPKPGSDPVVCRLATLASEDRVLKDIMRLVAAGNATPDQLRAFQGYRDRARSQIDEDQKRMANEANATQSQISNAPPQANLSQVVPQTPVQQSATPLQMKWPAQASVLPQQQAQSWLVVPSGPPPVILGFDLPGASEDRFLFPQYSILEALSPHHLLASFIVTRRGCHAADQTGLNLDQEYWQPVTMMLEVKYGLEKLPNFVKQWVKPADEVRRHMEAIMQRCERAPDAHLTLRLPRKYPSAIATVADESGISVEATPTASLGDKSKNGLAANTSTKKSAKKSKAPARRKSTAATKVKGEDSTVGTEREARPRRAARKSVRIIDDAYSSGA